MVTQNILDAIQELEKDIKESYEQVESAVLHRLADAERQIQDMKQDGEVEKKKTALHEETLKRLESKTQEETDRLKKLQDRLDELKTELERQAQQGNETLENQRAISSEFDSLDRLVKSLQKSVNDLSMEIRKKRSNLREEPSLSPGSENVKSKKPDLIGMIALVISTLLLLSAIAFGVLFWKNYQGLTEDVSLLMEKSKETPVPVTPAPTAAPTPEITFTPEPAETQTPTETPTTIESVVEDFRKTEVGGKLTIKIEGTEIETATASATEDPDSMVSNDNPGSNGEKSLNCILVFTSVKENARVTVESKEFDNTEMTELIDLQKKLSEIDSEAEFEWFPENPMKEFADNHGLRIKPVDIKPEDWESVMYHFDPFQVLILDLSDSGKSIYLVISKEDLSGKLSSVKAMTNTPEGLVWFNGFELDLLKKEDVNYYLIAKDKELAENKAKEFFEQNTTQK